MTESPWRLNAEGGGRAVAGVRQVSWRLAEVNANMGGVSAGWNGWFLRDWRHGKVRAIDPNVIDLVA